MLATAPRIDETAGLSLVVKEGEHREQTRYVFTAGDVIEPDRKYQVATLRAGGEEVASRCLRRTPNYIPRCELTPLEPWLEPIGIPELVPEGVRPVTVAQAVQPELPPLVNPTQFFRRNEPMIGIQHFPGEDLPLIIEVTGYRGVKEIESVRNKGWESGEVQALQEEFFPANTDKPIALRLIEDRIREVSLAGGIYKQIGDEKLMSCDAFRRWALRRIGVEHGLLNTRTAHQHTYSYSQLAPQLLAQLEMNPRDQGSESTELAKAIVGEFLKHQAPSAQPVSVDVEAIVKAVLMAQGALKQPAAAPEVFKCDKCEKTFDSSQGLQMHKNRWCNGKSE